MTGPFDIPDLPHAARLYRRGEGPGGTPYDVVVLGYDERLLRRRRLVTAHDEGFFVDLPQATGLEQGDRFELLDGRLIEVIAAEEWLVEVRGDLPRLAWHIGNRHTPCQIEPDRLLIRADHVLEAMLAGLGARTARISEPFHPEGGAYGHGRPMGHGHDHVQGHDHEQGHGQEPGHGHDHAPAHGHDHGHAQAAGQAHARSPTVIVRPVGQPLLVPHEPPARGPFDDPA